jgi:hypothetical protein
MYITRNLMVLLIPTILSCIGIFLFSILSVQAATIATTYTVCASGCDFSNIQDAIDAAAPGDTISLAGETFTESFTVDKSLNVEGAGSENTIIQAASAPGIASSRVVTITENTIVNISDITIRYGVAYVGRGGGGIINQGTVTISDSTIKSNTANYGGGITNGRLMTITNCIIDDNFASYWGGGLFLDNSSNNQPDETVITIQESIISNNMTEESASDNGGGGLFSYNSTANIYNTSFINNTVNGVNDGGGGLFISYRSIATIKDSLIAGNAADKGGGIKSEFESQLTINNSEITNNIARQQGGGIYNEEVSTIDITNSSISNNTSTKEGGGLYNYDRCTVTIDSTLFYSNTILGAFSGGGIHNNLYSSVSTWNSTFSQNSAGSYGGGIDNYRFSVVSTQHVTFEGNNALVGGSDVSSRYGTVAQPNTIYLEASILSGNTDQGNCYQETGTNEAHVVDNGYNIIEDGSCITAGTSFSADPKLDPLQDNGGATNTHGLLYGSPAIDVIPDGSCDLGVDQRGVSRPQGDGCDIGAFEVGSLPPSNHLYLPFVIK